MLIIRIKLVRITIDNVFARLIRLRINRNYNNGKGICCSSVIKTGQVRKTSRQKDEGKQLYMQLDYG